MGINESQLITWTHAPGSTKAQFTYAQVKKALEASNSLRGRYEIYLQGSYANSTNIRIDSDIDIVVQLTTSWHRDITPLPTAQQELYLSSVYTATYTLAHFKTDVVNALEMFFGKNFVKAGNKSIKLIKDEYRVNADIVPCTEYRKYQTFITHEIQTHVKGIKFYTLEGNEIINYPKLHLKNGEEKNKQHRTNERYKDMVRIIKNIRRVLSEKYGLDPNLARSYYIECAIYNVPDTLFNGSYQAALVNLLNHILYQHEAESFLAANHQHPLFGPAQWQWNTDDAVTFFKAVEEITN